MTNINTKNWSYFFPEDYYWVYRGYVNMNDYPYLDSNDYIDVRKAKYTTQIFGGKGSDTIYGSKKHMNFLYGDIAYEVFGTADDNKDYLKVSGNDTIYGGNSSDYINAGPGSDLISAGKGINVIMFKQGDGKDTLIQGKGKDYLYFIDTDFDNIRLERSGNDLIINYGDKTDKITVNNYFKKISKSSLKGIADMNTYLSKIQQAFNAFYETTEKQGISILKQALTQTKTITSLLAEQDYINTKMLTPGKFYGTDYNDNILGTSGNDKIYAGKGNDIINAGNGKNYIYLGKYDGDDIVENGGGEDTLVFSKVKKIKNISFDYDKSTKDLVIHYGNNNSVTIEDYSETHSVQKIKIGKRTYNISDRLNLYNNNISLSAANNIDLHLESITSEIAAFCSNSKCDLNLNYNNFTDTNNITTIVINSIQKEL